MAKGAARVAADVARRAPGVRYHGVASALDYDTARDAGRAFATAGLRAAAMGFGAYMRDGQYARELRIGGRCIQLSRVVPMRYLRCALAARGFWDGWREGKGGAPGAVHFLGLRAPIMRGIGTLAAARTPLLAFDATSPIQAAVEGTLYWAAPTYLKARTRRAARHLATGQWDRWRCPCPFCRDFVGRHPFDYRAGHDWGAAHPGDTEALAGDLKPGGALYAAYSLLSEPAVKDPLRNQGTQARSGHNHWMLQRVLADLRRHGRTPASLERHVRQVVETYAQATTDQYEQTVRISLDVVTGAKYVS